ncbi:methyltransferase type 12 [Richelia sinica FACHB-800]|uniref:Methyltransferase type 12 n=1 Tax=Richelia sinica FACHB-800 TaxID=1357546 RepID=A0A975T9Y5_9NOST|nr:class I SAM-dependent methyltransferase [Richelia sinica]MBD2665595.1 methyltransferase domain-containing protein [Richelia sinica FACHB-800]QXE24835.1 methyltransferase type 12 [Richelia sinica FACHB-800]
MNTTTLYTSYDPLARVYNEDWAVEVLKETIPALETLIFPNLIQDAQILDLGCGTGQLAQKLMEKGYKVTGIDASAGMLHYARENAPEAKLILNDARLIDFYPTFDAVISIGAFNHVMSLEELTNVFHKVYQSLLDHGIFLFYLFLEEEYLDNWNGKITGNVKEDYAWAAKNSYDLETKIASINLTIFSLIDNTWQRLDSTISEKCYTQEELILSLKTVGFSDIRVYDAHLDLNISRMPGCKYFVCHKQKMNGKNHT